MSSAPPDEAEEPTRATKWLFSAILVGFGLLLVEAFAFATFFASDLYDHRDAVLARIDEESLAEARRRADPLLGWDSGEAGVSFEKNCLGDEIEYAVDEEGARTYRGYDGSSARVVVVGDSYTWGDEAVAEDTYPARLAALLDASVSNLGVRAYGPVQSLLRLEQKLDRFPEARVVVLGIMYENVYRMVNSYRPVLYDKTSPFAFKPYLAAGRIEPHPGPAALRDVEHVIRHAERAFDADFWAKPRHRFPYTLSLAGALGSNFFYYRKLGKRLRSLGFPEYFLTYRSAAIRSELFDLLDAFATLARQRSVTPIALFIPRNRLDTRSVSELLASGGDALASELIVADLGSANVDWSRFNLEEPGDDNICHPSPYGHREIADFVAALLRSKGSWPASS